MKSGDERDVNGLTCSFCCKSNIKAENIIVGTMANICKECIIPATRRLPAWTPQYGSFAARPRTSAGRSPIGPGRCEVAFHVIGDKPRCVRCGYCCDSGPCLAEIIESGILAAIGRTRRGERCAYLVHLRAGRTRCAIYDLRRKLLCDCSGRCCFPRNPRRAMLNDTKEDQ